MPTNIDVSGVARRAKIFWRFGDVQSGVITHDHLMEESERRLTDAARSGIPGEELVATRIMENPKDFRRWESEHATIMQRICCERAVEAQRSALLAASLALIHRKAMFEYLRDCQVRGLVREKLIGYFYGSTDYPKTMVLEHGIYLRSAASYLCSSHVGTDVMLDEIFDAPLQRYEVLYTEYFRAYCETTMAPNDPRLAYTRSLLGPLKEQVKEWRNALGALANSRSGTWRLPRFQ